MKTRQSRSPDRLTPRPLWPGVLGLAFAALFTILASVRLGAQGLQYDEINQAVGAFELLGRPSPMFVQARIWGIPVLVQTWTGALKTNLFGVFLALTGLSFEPVTWRLFGIGLAALGILVFFSVLGRRLRFLAAVVVGGLTVSDVTLLLHSRHEVGPVALSFALRLLFLAVLVRQAVDRGVSAARGCVLGLVVALGIFEKLSSVGLVLPLLFALVAFPELRQRRALAGLALGGSIGLMPLLMVNLDSLLTEGVMISWRQVFVRDYPPLAPLRYVAEWMSLGTGDDASRMILGEPASSGLWFAESVLVAAGLTVLIAALVGPGRARRSGEERLALVLLLGWAAMAVFFALLPKGTTTHHWVSATPVHYLAFALALSGAADPRLVAGDERVGGDPRGSRRRVVLLILVSLLLVARTARLIEVERALSAGKSSHQWDPSLTEFGRFAATVPEAAIIVAADWGIATQVFALSGGRPDHVIEPFWRYPGARALAADLERRSKCTAFVVALDPPSSYDPLLTHRILKDTTAWPGWRRTELDPGLRGLKAVRVIKLERIGGVGSPGAQSGGCRGSPDSQRVGPGGGRDVSDDRRQAPGRRGSCDLVIPRDRPNGCRRQRALASVPEHSPAARRRGPMGAVVTGAPVLAIGEARRVPRPPDRTSARERATITALREGTRA